MNVESNTPFLTLESIGTDDLDAIAEQMLQHFPGQTVFGLSGPMGAGKTTFIQAVCRNLGVTDNVSSPTFSIVNEYLTGDGNRVYHFDLYRLRKTEELLDIGYEDYFYSGNYCFIEWPELAGELMPDDGVRVVIKVNEHNGQRLFTFSRF
ncbi:MAG TPA: tRNA (adenosine(37)-N6)-threonylcarbamoyltransferase complex ATPase subunit type 1 TsaE [Lentimicrobium sp.]|jgi:tRNA threonylcarbamoyladenosine biosynthesis protein TsaE|nr:tRNA (adenosine(37)-N6)-threonylcarbamoyltransferase complex ATPase subunit type 1 TsaE [Lentimicrobium sp.]